MRKIIYRGAEQIFRIVCSSRTVYTFEQDNNFSATPSTWADYYDIISYDSTHKTLVDAKDTLAATDLRRKSQFEYEVPVEIYEQQVERDIKAKEDKAYQALIVEYKRGIYDQIASGILEAIPETINDDAIAYADKKTAPKEDTVFPMPPEEPSSGNQEDGDEEVIPPTDEEETKPGTEVEEVILPLTGDETPAAEGETAPSDPKAPEETTITTEEIIPITPIVEPPKEEVIEKSKDSKK